MLAPLVLAAALYDPVTGAKTLENGILSAPLGGELSQAARLWALGRRAELGLPPDATLVNGPSFATRFGASFHLQQQLDGIEVYGANLVVTVDQTARVVLVTSSLQSWREARKGWLIGEAEALARAAHEVVLPALRADGTPFGAAKKVYLPIGDEVHAGWLVHVPTLDIRQNLYFAIDATTGATLHRWNRVFHAALDAKAYRVSPGGLDAGVGITPTVTVSLTHPDGGSMLSPDAGGVLVGTQLDAFNCCVLNRCDATAPDAGPRRARGTTTLPFVPFPVRYDIPTCDFRQSATNDPARNDAGSFEYPPIDPPKDGGFDLFDPAASDPFSEVHGFYQVNRVYDWVRGLSRAARPLFPGHQPMIVPFAMRDERRVPPRKPSIWNNVVFPDVFEIANMLGCLGDMDAGCVVRNFGRFDNAAFMAVENFAQIPLPEYRSDVDTVMMFQGDKADFSYDSTVLWHEFGHGAIYSTAGLGLDRLSIDNRSANNESGALHEGLADYISGAYGGESFMGPYVGPRASAGGQQMIGVRPEPFLRSLDNTLACPEVLTGEVHDDSQHVSAALWRARQDVYQGSDDGGTFDATFYAALVSLSMTADFAQLASSMTTHVNVAFADAGQAMADLFNQRGVTNCGKVLDVTGQPPRRAYGIGSRSQTTLSSGLVPGPYQLRVRTPNGAASVSVSGRVAASGPLGLGGQPRLRALARAGSPISFARVGGGLQNDSTTGADVAIAMGGGAATATLMVNAPCGPASDVYVTIANDGMGPATVTDLALSVTPPASCTMMDGGTDGGARDGGSRDGGGTIILPGITQDGGMTGVVDGPSAGGCGCGASSVGVPLSMLLALVLRRRRKHPRPL